MSRKRRPSARYITALVVVVMASLWILNSPAWRTYNTQHHVADALAHVAGAKLAVMEAATIRGGLSEVSAHDLGYNASATTDEYVSQIDVADGGIIVLTTRNTGASPDPVIVLVPLNTPDGHGDIVWSCQVFQGDRSLVPAGCQNSWSAPGPQPTTLGQGTQVTLL